MNTAVREFLRAAGLSDYKIITRPATGEQAIMECPFCYGKGETFAVNTDDGAYKCMRANNCGVSGSFSDLQRALIGEIKYHTDGTGKREPKSPQAYRKPDKIIGKVTTDLEAFFISRKIPIEFIKKFNIVEEMHDFKKKDGSFVSLKSAVIPYYKNGKVVHVKYRALKEKLFATSSGTELTFFNYDGAAGFDYVIITEGEFDCIVWVMMGFNAVSIPNGSDALSCISAEREYLKQFKKIYINFDNDEAGQNGGAGKGGAKKAIELIGRGRCYNIKLPMKDANMCLGRNMEKRDFADCLESADRLTPDNVKKPEEFAQGIADFLLNPDKFKGHPTGVAGLDEILGGWRMKEVSIWTGRSGDGKTTLLNQVINLIAMSKKKSLICSFEMSKEVNMSWVTKQSLRFTFFTYEDIISTVNELSESIIVMDQQDITTPEELETVMEYSVLKEDVKHIFIDSLMMVYLGEGRNDNASVTNFMLQLLRFVRRNDCHIHLVAHPRKLKGEREKMGRDDIAGTGNLFNMAHNVLQVTRPSQWERDRAAKRGEELPDMILSVKKNRMWRRLGDVSFTFDDSRLWFTEVTC